MTNPINLSRRSALLGAAALPLVAGSGVLLSVGRTSAAGHSAGKTNAPFAHFKVGDFVVTTLLAGANPSEEPQKTFAMNASPEDFAAASTANFISTEKYVTYFTPTIVNTGADVVLFDTGLPGGDNAPNVVAAMASAGYAPEDVTVVVITHMHPDHIGGLMNVGNPTFPNAKYFTGSAEYNFWSNMDAGNRVGDMVAGLVTPLADKMTFLEDGGSPASGITAITAFGHTPGHMTYMVESGGQQLLLAADFANHYVWSLAYPDWEVRFDGDKAAAAATRKRVLGMLAADKIPFIGYHMPFPAVGYVEAVDSGFRYVPESYQLAL
ncbi:MAG: MBL fold metallo-hydrolase [Pseudomonadota bacterium]